MRLFFRLLFAFYTGGISFAAGAAFPPRSAASAGAAFPAGSDPVVFRQLIATYFDGVAGKDFRKLVAVTTPDFVIYEFGKKWNNDSVFKNIQYHEPFSVKFALTDFVAFADAQSGDATYHSHADFAFGDSDMAQLDFYETATFRKTAAGWKINMIQVSAVAPPVVNIPGDYRRYDTVRYIPDHYRERRAVFAGEALSSGRVVFFGNSITEFGEWKRLLRDSGAVNRGIAGDNTFGMLDRLGEVIALRPAALFIEAGINDIGEGVPPALIAANIGSMVQYVRVKSPGTRVYVVSVLPTNGHAQTDYPEIAGKNEIAREVDRLLVAQAAVRGYIYLDLASRLATATGELDEHYAQPDGLHLNDAGYGVWMGMIAR
jgi:lysophospholipase L1-like esterase/ketosteroid isomerase-like protein